MEDKLPTIDTSPTFTYLNKKTGLLETINSITGDIIAVQSTPDPMALKAGTATLQKVNGREILVEPGVSLDAIGPGHRKSKWVYSTMMGEIISQRISEGAKISQICREEGMPPIWVVTKWRNDNSSFDHMLSIAEKTRAHYHRDQVITVAEENMHVEGGVRILTEAHKWAAQTDFSEKFGNKTKAEVEVKGTIKFVIDTGIRRPGDPGYNKDQTKIVQDIQREKDVTQTKAVAESASKRSKPD